MSSDPAATDPEHLLQHVTWLRGLARSLVGDRALADDLVQETWVAALRRPPDAAHPLRPWLRKVVTNLARFRWRGDANRAVREQAMGALAAEVPSTEELLERHETQQLLARLVTELEEPYRAAILLRYAEGLAPGDIARRLGLPAGTVRWRLHEGLQRLRARLDALHRGDRRAWMAVLAPLANRLARAPAPAISPLVIVALALIAAIAVWVVVRLLAPPPTTTAAPPDPRMGAPVAPRGSRGDWVSELASGQPPGWIAQEGAPARRIAGRVVVDGAPRAGALVRLTSELSLAELQPVREQRTTAEGRFDFGVEVAREFTVAAAVPGRLAAIQHVDLRDPTARPAPDGDAQLDGVRLVIDARRLAIRGTIVDATGAPVGDARVRAWGNGVEPEYLVPVPAGTTDPEGAFRIGDLAPGSYALEVRTLDGARRVARDIAARTPDVKLVVDAAICRNPQLAGAEDPMRAAIVAGEPTDIPYRPPGRIVWDEQIELLGWNLPKIIGLDQRFEVTLYYKVLRPIDRSWKIFLHFAGPGWHNADHDPLDGRCPTSTWQPGDVIVDRFTTKLGGDKLTRGTYDVRIGFYTGWAPSWSNLPISEAPALLRDKPDGVKLTALRVE